MAARRDYYVVLGVPPDADSTAIKNAFRQAAGLPGAPALPAVLRRAP